MVSSTFHAHRNPPNSRPPLVHLETRVGRLTDSSLRHSILLHRCPVNEFDLERPSLITRAIIVSTGYSAISLFKIFFFLQDIATPIGPHVADPTIHHSLLSFSASPTTPPPSTNFLDSLELNTRRFGSLGKGIQRNDSFGFLCNELQSGWCNFTECIVPGQLSKFRGPVESPRAERRRSGLVKLPH